MPQFNQNMNFLMLIEIFHSELFKLRESRLFELLSFEVITARWSYIK